MPYVESRIVIEAPAARVYELAKDQERFPSSCRTSRRVIGRSNAVPTASSPAGRRWSRKRRSSGPRRIASTTNCLRIDYKLLEGDLDKFEGAWTFEHRDGVTHVVLGVDYDFGVPTLAELIGPDARRKRCARTAR